METIDGSIITDKMANKRISIIIPSIDRKNFVLDLIEDLSKQEMSFYEIIVIDQSQEPYNLTHCEYYHIESKGPCNARNFGFGKSKGDIVVFLDDDIRVDPDFIQELCGPVVDNKYRAVTGAMCDAKGNYISSGSNSWKKRNIYPWILTMTASPGHPGTGVTISMTTCCCAIEKSLLNQLGLFDTFFDPNGAGEDREMALRIFNAGYAILYNGSAKAYHLSAPRGGRKSISNNDLNPLMANSVYIVYKYFGKKVFDEYCDNWIRRSIKKKISWHPLSWARAYRFYFIAKRHIRYVKGKHD